jgi:hypothetical protein
MGMYTSFVAKPPTTSHRRQSKQKSSVIAINSYNKTALHLVRHGLMLLHSIRAQALLVVAALVGKLRVVFDVRDADLGVVAVEDAGDFLESGAPVEIEC